MATQKTLIIKLGAAGDVVRTTVLLHALGGEVTWVTEDGNIPLLPDHPSLAGVMSISQAAENLRGRRFDLVISLDDEPEAARLATEVERGELAGTYLDASGRVAYTESSAGWFDMGLVSRFGKARADEIKKVNRRTYQEFLFQMIGREFRGEEYLLRTDKPAVRRPDLVGIESRAGGRWPTKRWNRYDALAERLSRAGYTVRFFEQRNTVGEYIADIGEGNLLVTGDTLSLHIGLALKLQVVAIFTCTSPAEIFDYGRLQKVISPGLNDAFYRTDYVAAAVESISLSDVAQAVRSRGFEIGHHESESKNRSGHRPLVYAILVNWNGKEDTLACLRSLRKVDYPGFRTVVVDNASSDGSLEVVAAEFPETTLVANSKNEMFSRANNQGIDLALREGADYVLLLNNDTEVDPEFLGFLIEKAESDPGIGMVGPKIYYFDQPDLLWYAGGIVSLRRGLIAHRGIRQPDRGQFDRPGDTGYISACCLLVSRRCIEKAGVLDDGYYIYGEDADWCFRARRAGFRVVYEPRSKVWHKVSSSSGGKNISGGLTPFKVHHKIRSMLKFFGRYAKWHHWLTIPFFAAGYFFKAAWLMARSRNWAGIGALVSVSKRRKV